jgi:hypothetical protein
MNRIDSPSAPARARGCAAKNHVYPLINWSDLHIGIVGFQRKLGLIPPEDAPKK